MKYYSILFLICFSFTLKAQKIKLAKSDPDSSYTIPMITVSYARQFPGADLSDRFGSNNNVGGNFLVKTKSQWVYGFKGNFIWSDNVENQSILQDLQTSEGDIIDNEGRLTEVFLGQQGSSFFFFGGRLFNVFSPNKNSGILVYGGLGTLHHKITFSFQDEINALSDEGKKGYDRLSFGYGVNGFLGYLYLSKNRLLNFFGGFDFTQARTTNLRKFNVDTRMPDTRVNTDRLYGIRVGWIIRLNKRQSDSFYYN